MKKFIALLFLIPLCALAETDKPNVVYILADDLGIGDLSCYGQQKISTPNIDGLAKGGMKFTRHYSGTCVCAPSRSSLMTGQTTGHTPIRGNRQSTLSEEGQQEMPADTVTFPKILQQNGYRTGCFGKWGLGWQDSLSSPMKMGFDEFFGYNCQVEAHYYYPDHLWHNSRRVNFPNNRKEEKFYSADLIQEQVLKFIDESASQKDRKPFFIFYAMTLPHAELRLPKKYTAQFEGKFAPEKAYKNNNTKLGGYGSQDKPNEASAGMVAAIDTFVGEIVEKLKQCGMLKNTLIIFTSDNGTHNEGGHDPKFWNSNGGLRGIKRDLYEGGIRAPMIAFWDGKIAANSTSSHMSAFWDVMPTMCELAGAKTPSTSDGISMLPTLLGDAKNQKPHDSLYWEFHENGGKQAVRAGDWKLVKLQVKNKKKTRYELYNIASDERETIDVLAANPEKFAELKKIMDSARTPSDIAEWNF